MEQHSNKNIFITGITGFTGKYLEENLTKNGFFVYGTTLSEPKSNNHFYCNILNEDSLFEILQIVKPIYVIHLAAISFVASEDQKSIYDVNIFGTINLLNAIKRQDYIPKKILIASSAAVYGNIQGELSEEICPQAVNHYGNSKLVMENMAKQYFNTLNIIIVRPFNYTGIGQENHFIIPKIVTHYKLNKKEIELGNIDVYREFNDINFVVETYLKLLFSNIKSEIFNVCSGNVYNIKKIISIMNEIAGYQIEVRINQAFIRQNEVEILKGSTKKLFQTLNIRNDNFNLEKTLREMFLY